MQTVFVRDAFASAIGSDFKLTAPNGRSVEAPLVEVSPLKKRQYQQSFSIVFLLPETYSAEQCLFDVEHPSFGVMQLLLVPIGMHNGRLRLEAVFNLLLDLKNI